ncbi:MULTISPECIES: hypothetical protein [Pseudomonas]|uniref:Uncharacterized protein n=1 Tax=Pseudomonas fluorescens TaxID=294 RepID=A0A5E7VSG3_PSEFL|nr:MULTISPECIES: hypothetical protein [Pseudomonas]OPK07352.1 hypothetical protein BZ163_27395 [Pseudomonas sp. VI4.1]VVQ25771.1 hypothetical protein PS928_06178 [Pseudomonas fluorescens]
MQDIELLFRTAIERAGYTTVFYALGELAQVMNPGEHHQGLWISYKKERIVVRSDSSGFVCFRVDLAKERLEQLL